MCSLNSSPKGPKPEPDVLELSLFGPGFGECVVVHLGLGEWLVVDSCLSESGQPVALQYLEEIGVDYAASVKAIVITHWHDDHFRGVAALLSACKQADFFCSLALLDKSYFEIAVASRFSAVLDGGRGAKEFDAVIRELDSRGKVPIWVQEGSTLFRRDDTPTIEVIALSPSSASVTAGLGLAAFVPKCGETVRKLPDIDENGASVGLLVECQPCNLLLGGDLEWSADPSRGWGAVITSPRLPNVKSEAYKVAHHGSGNADHSQIWTLLLHPNPVALLTSWAKGGRDLPTSADVARIKQHTCEIYCPAHPASKKADAGELGRFMDEVAISRRAVRQKPGHVQLRMSAQGENVGRQIRLFDGAKRLGTELAR